jgi:ribosomal protein S18 acetylase RimI-like enzyme
MTDFTVRRADAGDIPALSALRLAYLTADCGGYDPALPERLAPYFTAHLNHDCFAAIAEVPKAGAIAAALLVCAELPPNNRYPHGKYATVYSVYTAPEHRGQGIASDMLRLLLDIAAQQGTDRVLLSATEAGMGVYERLGFVRKESHYTEMEYIFDQQKG